MLKNKICFSCKLEKEIINFRFLKKEATFHSYCNDCNRKKQKVADKKREIKRKQYYEINKIDILQKRKIYASSNKNKINAQKYDYWQRNPDKKRKWKNINRERRYKKDEFFKVVENLRKRFKTFLTVNKLTKNSKFADYIGCSKEELKTYLQNKFESGMTWDNYKMDTWQIDHIIPLGMAYTESEVVNLLHFKNLKPMWTKDHIQKTKKDMIIIREEKAFIKTINVLK